MGIQIKPFSALRPSPENAHLVACKPYDVLTSAEAKAEAIHNEKSFYYIDKAEINLSENIDSHSEIVYETARKKLHQFIENNILIRESKPCFYVYQLVMNGRSQTGLVANSSAQDYFDNKIKKHEFTRPVKEKDRIDHMFFTQTHASPVFLCYRKNIAIDEIVQEIKKSEPLFDFTADDNIRHTIWKMENDSIIQKIQKHFADEVICSYIADGHHRAASSAKVSLLMKEQNKEHTGDEDYNFFLSVLFPDNELQIMDYNRVIRDLNNKNENEIFAQLASHFSIEKKGKTPYKPEQLHTLGMYWNGEWYKLTAKPHTYNDTHPIDSLDVTVLSKYVLDNIFGIADQRTDDRVDFVGGIRGLAELEKRVNSGESKIAFALFPVTLQQLMAISDADEVMPPKSTWFEPKLRSGLLIHQFG